MHCPLDARAFSSVDDAERKREEAYQRYLALRETPEYQEKMRLAMARHGVKP